MVVQAAGKKCIPSARLHTLLSPADVEIAHLLLLIVAAGCVFLIFTSPPLLMEFLSEVVAT